jgi:hypothetical protein
MTRGAALVVLVAVLAAAAQSAPPPAGILVPGRSLGGIRLGMTPAQVERAWGRSYGVCRGCRDRTWYFNYRPFAPQGAGVSFRRSRAAAVFTLWSPPGWRTSDGLRLGDGADRVNRRYRPLRRRQCLGYAVLALRRRGVVTDFYVVNGALWGFGLRRPRIPPCR